MPCRCAHKNQPAHHGLFQRLRQARAVHQTRSCPWHVELVASRASRSDGATGDAVAPDGSAMALRLQRSFASTLEGPA
jgi:hypothetical protein